MAAEQYTCAAQHKFTCKCDRITCNWCWQKVEIIFIGDWRIL